MELRFGLLAVVLVSFLLVGCSLLDFAFVRPDYTISGQVFDSDTGEPLVGVLIKISPDGVAVTGADGEWEYAGAKKGAEVTASKDSWEFEPAVYRVKGEEADINFAGTFTGNAD